MLECITRVLQLQFCAVIKISVSNLLEIGKAITAEEVIVVGVVIVIIIMMNNLKFGN